MGDIHTFIVGDIVLFHFPIISFFWFEVHFGYSANRIFTISGNENTKLAQFLHVLDSQTEGRTDS